LGLGSGSGSGLGLGCARRLQGAEAVAARLEVSDGVGAPQSVAEVRGLVARGEQPEVDLVRVRVGGWGWAWAWTSGWGSSQG
jgi:hypothetical protein